MMLLTLVLTYIGKKAVNKKQITSFSCEQLNLFLHNLADMQFSNSGLCIFSLPVHDIDQGICSI